MMTTALWFAFVTNLAAAIVNWVTGHTVVAALFTFTTCVWAVRLLVEEFRS